MTKQQTEYLEALAHGATQTALIYAADHFGTAQPAPAYLIDDELFCAECAGGEGRAIYNDLHGDWCQECGHEFGEGDS